MEIMILESKQLLIAIYQVQKYPQRFVFLARYEHIFKKEK